MFIMRRRKYLLHKRPEQAFKRLAILLERGVQFQEKLPIYIFVLWLKLNTINPWVISL